MDDKLGRAFVEALGRKDGPQLKAILRYAVDFRALTPDRFWESSSSEVVVDDILLGEWFGPADAIGDVNVIDTAEIGLRQRVGYRLGVTNIDGRYLVEQQAYWQAMEDRIGWLRIMCSGFQSVQ